MKKDDQTRNDLNIEMFGESGNVVKIFCLDGTLVLYTGDGELLVLARGLENMTSAVVFDDSGFQATLMTDVR